MFRYFKPIILILLTLFSYQIFYAQTCRVKSGKMDKGSPLYTKVYEYEYVDVKPEFPGGGKLMVDFINSNREYPAEAYQNGIEGRVTCSFIVNSDGKLSHIQVLKGVEPSLNNEALRIISEMPEWHPGFQDGVAVPVRVVYCIPFRR